MQIRERTIQNTMNPKVFHVRLPGFLIQAERIEDPGLATRAVGIVSADKSDGTLVAVSEEATEEGVRPGMPVSLVRKMSPRTVLVPANSSLYHKVHRTIYDVMGALCPVVEPGDIGQFYLDMHGMERIYRSDRHAGDRVMKSIRRKADFRSQVGISRNKLVSAITTKVIPERLYSVEYGGEGAFLAPLASGNLPITGEKVVRSAIRDLNTQIVEDLQNLTLSEYSAEVVFGRYGLQVRRQSYGIDTSAVKPPQIRDHIVERQVLEVDTNDEDNLLGVVRLLAEQVAFQLREQERIAGKVVLSLHYTDGYESRATGSLPAYSDRAVIREMQQLYDRANIRRNRVRSVTADVSQFRPFVRQMDLFDDAELSPEDNLSKHLDSLRKKYGHDVVKSAAALLQAA